MTSRFKAISCACQHHGGRMLVCTFLLCFAANWLPAVAAAPRDPELAPERTKSGTQMLSAFEPVSAAARNSVVRFDVDEKEVALGAVVDASGLVLTKASEVQGREITCKLANGDRVEAQVRAADPDTDLALVKISATGLKPVQWSSSRVAVGQWVITPGLDKAPDAVGIVSVPTRKIPPKKAYIGIALDYTASEARIASIMPGLGAEKAGLLPGDVILAVNDSTVNDNEELIAELATFREGQRVQVRYRRDAEELEAEIELAVPKPTAGERRFNRQERMNRFGSQLSQRSEGFQMAIQHDTVLQAWECGGPLLNLDGKAIGLNIARAGRVASYALPEEVVRSVLAKLRSPMH